MRDIFWVSTFEYIAVYEIQSEMRVVYIQNVRNLLANSLKKLYADIFKLFRTENKLLLQVYKGH